MRSRGSTHLKLTSGARGSIYPMRANLFYRGIALAYSWHSTKCHCPTVCHEESETVVDVGGKSAQAEHENTSIQRCQPRKKRQEKSEAVIPMEVGDVVRPRKRRKLNREDATPGPSRSAAVDSSVVTTATGAALSHLELPQSAGRVLTPRPSHASPSPSPSFATAFPIPFWSPCA